MNRRRQKHRFLDDHLIEGRQRSGQSRAYRADIGVGWIPPGIRLTSTEDLGDRVELDVGFQADYGLIVSHGSHLPARVDGRTASSVPPWHARRAFPLAA